jgi:glucose/arabinose dehydrogenase
MTRQLCTFLTTLLATLALQATASAQLDHLPSIPKGDTPGHIAVNLQPIATGMAAPDYAISPRGDTQRLFVVEQNGLLRIIRNGTLQAGAALDLSNVAAGGGLGPFNPGNANDERGFLGLAFHPNFNAAVGTPGRGTLYTYSSAPLTTPTYAAPNGATQGYQLNVNEWKMTGSDPTSDVVDITSRREIISFGHNANNHNGGTLAFGSDGYLYLAPGDGGNANDVGASHIEPGGNAQNLTTPLGKMLRIDVNSDGFAEANRNYSIPADNPNMGPTQTVPEIYASGLRNPYRFAFDRPDLGGTGDLVLADVGQNNIEEINRIVKGGNYGWAVKEGTFNFFRTVGPNGEPVGSVGTSQPGSPAGLIDPIEGTPDPNNGNRRFLQYDHQDGISITGGFVYRGSAIPELVGKYVFGDLAIRGGPRVDGRLFYADLEDGTIHEFFLPQFVSTEHPGGQLPNSLTVHGFGEDEFGELYALVTNTPANGTGGIVYKLVAVPEPSTALAFVGALGLLAARRPRR